MCAQMYDKEGREYQGKWAHGVPLLAHRGLSGVQGRKVGARRRRAVYDVATEHGQVVIINCHVLHGRRVNEYVVQLRMEYMRVLETGPVIVVGDFNYHPWRRKWTANRRCSWRKCSYRMCHTVGCQAPHTTRHWKAARRRG